MTGWERWSTENCAKDQSLAMLTNSICKNLESVQKNGTHKIFWKIWDINGSLNPTEKIKLFVKKENKDFDIW